jgi:hypothetical protein
MTGRIGSIRCASMSRGSSRTLPQKPVGGFRSESLELEAARGEMRSGARAVYFCHSFCRRVNDRYGTPGLRKRERNGLILKELGNTFFLKSTQVPVAVHDEYVRTAWDS